MSQLQKKCLIASVGMHSTLVLILVVGSAFFLPPPKNEPTVFVNMIPSIMIDNAMAGGGGDPKIPETKKRQKGETLIPQPVKPPEPKPPEPEPPKIPEPKKEAVEPPKEAVKPPKVEPKPRDTIKLSDLKPVPTRKTTTDTTESNKKKNDTRRDLARAFERAADDLTPAPGFNQGTATKIGGPGGPAYADYKSWVGAVYDDAWIVTDEVADDNTSVGVEVTIAQDGDVISARIIRRSGNAALDRSVERTLAIVKSIRKPFPASWKEKQKTFPINFNLKSKRSAG